jgi:predicted permease
MVYWLRSVRSLLRYWKLTAISVFSLAIAMALGVLALSVSNTLLILQPAAADPNRLVMIYEHSPDEAIDQVSYPDYQYFREHNRVFTDIAAAPNSIGINDDLNFSGHEVKVVTRPVSENYFAVMGLRPFLGRFFAPGDDKSANSLAVMTWSCWKRLGADPHIAGKVVAGQTIVGVTPKEFTGAFYGVNGDLFTNLHGAANAASFNDRAAHRLMLIARLKPGVTKARAQAELAALSGQLATAYPKEDKGRSAVVTRATLLPPDALPDLEWITAILMALVLLVLLIASANVGNLLLATAIARRQEAAIKLALGAPRGRLIREFLRESALICIAGGMAGYAIAVAVAARFSDFTIVFPMWGAFSFGAPLRFDGPVLAFALLLVAGATLATGLPPALYASSPSIAPVIGGEAAAGGVRKSARRNALVIVQVAVCTLVLTGMGLGLRNLYNLRHADLGFSARNLVAQTMYLEAEGYDEPRAKQFRETARAAVSAIPGVESVAITKDLPLFGSSPLPVRFSERPKVTDIAHTIVDANYFRTLGIKLLAGRPFDGSDHENGPRVAIINHKMAEMFWPGRDPVGKQFLAGAPLRAVTVVGIAADGKYDDIDEGPRPFVYLPLSQNYGGGVTLIARTHGDPHLWIQTLAKTMRGLGLKVLVSPATFEDWMNLNLIGERVAAIGAGILSALGLLLAIIGLAGSISYSVGQRRKELGIRIALGARRWQLLQMVLRETAVVAGAGIGFGLLLGIAATIALRSQLYRVGAVEWAVLIPAGAAMLALSLLTACISARPGLSADPIEAVRHV